MDGLTGGSGGTEAFPLNELLILRCRDAGSKEEMERIVASLVPGESAESVIASLRQE